MATHNERRARLLEAIEAGEGVVRGLITDHNSTKQKLVQVVGGGTTSFRTSLAATRTRCSQTSG